MLSFAAMISENFDVVKTMKETEKSVIKLLQHKALGKQVVLRTYTGSCAPYRVLVVNKHINIPEVFEAIQDGEKAMILEEYLEGVTVGERLKGGLFSEKESCEMIASVCEGAAALHSLGIIHRDIKPDNIIILNNGTVKLFDFDASRIFEGKNGDTRIIGTVGYAAPEQFGIAESDRRTDVYAIGITLNVMLTGKHPIIETYGGALGKIISKCTETNPDKRYQSTEEIRRHLPFGHSA